MSRLYPALTILLGFVLCFGSCGNRAYKGMIRFDQDIEGHLKRAADANSVDLAKQELDTALANIEKWGLCGKGDLHAPDNCYTSVIYRTPDEDIGFWRTNLTSARADLESMPADADHLTVSNSLMKLRETLLDTGDSGTYVTYPNGISIYPNNEKYTLAFNLGWFLLLVGIFLLPNGPSRAHRPR